MRGAWKISTAETKIILVLCYYALFGLVALSYFAVESAYQEDQFQAIQQYFVCEAVGSGTECDRSEFDNANFGYPGLTLLVYLMLGLIPAVNLTFVINWTVVGKSCKHFWMKHFLKTTISQATKENNLNTVNRYSGDQYIVNRLFPENFLYAQSAQHACSPTIPM